MVYFSRYHEFPVMEKICLNGDIVIDHIMRKFLVEKITKFVNVFNLNANAAMKNENVYIFFSIMSYPHL